MNNMNNAIKFEENILFTNRCKRSGFCEKQNEIYLTFSRDNYYVKRALNNPRLFDRYLVCSQRINDTD